MKNIKINIAIIIYILYQEIIYMTFSNVDFENLLLKILFTIQVSLIICIVFVFNRRINKILAGILLAITCVLYISQYLYYKTFNCSLSIYSIIKGIQILQFGNSIFDIILSNWYVLLLFIIPVLLYFILYKQITIERNTKKEVLILLILSIIVYLVTVLKINLDKEERICSVKNLYYNINNGEENIRMFGVFTTARLDIQRTITSFKEKKLYQYENNDGNVKILEENQYNMININFDSLIESEDDEEIKEIHEYIKSQEPTKKNKYTGKFSNKNLIVIVAESFSSLAIREDVTPTLYKLANEGFRFKNFYTPLFPVSTADGEYLTDTGILPSEGVWSIEEVEEKLFPYSYANVLKEQGYNTYAYHNYEYDYYQRQKYFKTMGYEKYLAKGNGLEKRMDFSKNPSSDYEMIKSTICDYVNDEKFLAYYLTMSGHMSYDETHAIVNKNWEKVNKLPYSDKVKAYLATQIELDKAVEELMTVLKENGKLADTVIVISSDHYPYGLNENEIKELSVDNMNDYDLDKFHMPLIIYNSEIKENIEITKYASSLDVLPTVLNLFGIKYDSRLLMGRDILSDASPLVIFSNRSFITKIGKYNKDAKIFTEFEDNKNNITSDEYIKKVQQQIYLKFRISRLILENDYYRILSTYIK